MKAPGHMHSSFLTSSVHNAPAMQPTAPPLASHPRRPPAHLSVSLKHERTPADEYETRSSKVRRSTPSSSSPKRLSKGESCESGNGAQKWFNSANENAAGGVEDNDPPFFLKRSDSSASITPSDGEPNLRDELVVPPVYSTITHQHHHAATNDSSADDFRSVIDDLTIQNRELKERLKKYESLYSTHLEDEKLFEVKMHGLAPHKRRELEETLRSFASTVSPANAPSSRKLAPGKWQHTSSSLGRSPYGNPSSSSTSNSRPVDSAYASMNSSEPKSFSGRNHVHLAGNRKGHPTKSPQQKVQSFLHDIPKGLLPKHYPGLSEKAKRKIIVRRLEQLFSGKRSPVDGPLSQPLQQQEISASAAKADREANGASDQKAVAEGVREAHIFSGDMDIDPPKGSQLEAIESRELGTVDAENVAPEQRPTRPLDLDPDRAQIPNENVEYIRHLGLDSPKFVPSTDATDSEGWVYLNLLVSMAQLHMLNVTPDFIRLAVSEVSEKFEVSHDGKKLRWRGGSDRTRLSSDSGVESVLRSPSDSDSLGESGTKWRNGDGESWEHRAHDLQQSRTHFQSIPMVMPDHASFETSEKKNACYYKPLFKHKQSSSGEESEVSTSENVISDEALEMSRTGFTESGRAAATRIPYHSRGKRRVDEGPLVFYSGASFCIDLSADTGSVTQPRYNANAGRDGYSKITDEALGCKPVTNIHAGLQRTDSGSLLMLRPFKDYSKSGEILQSSGQRPRTPAPVTSEDEDDERGSISFNPEWSRLDLVADKRLSDLNVSGLGGTRPADHFQVTVETRHPRLDSKSRARLSKFSAPNAKRRKFVHSVARSSLDSFREPGRSADLITSRLASLRADSPPVAHASEPVGIRAEMPARCEIISTKLRVLEPSNLPPPAMWYSERSSDSFCSDDDETTDLELARLKQRVLWSQPVQNKRFSSSDNTDVEMALAANTNKSKLRSSAADDDVDLDSDDESIDILAAARELDPEAVAAQEAEYDSETRNKIHSDMPFGSAAATINEESGDSEIDDDSDHSSYGSESSDGS